MKKIMIFVLLFLFSDYLFSQTGVVNNGARLVISNGAKLDIDGNETAKFTNNEGGITELNGAVELEGDWVNNSSSPDVFAVFGENAIVVFDGNQTQTIRGAYESNFPQLTVDGNFSLSNNISLPQNFTLNSGIVYLNDYNLILGENSEIVTENSFSPDNMIVTNGTGQLIKKIPTNGIYYFPVGDADGNTNFSPVTIDISASEYTNADISVHVTNEKHPYNTNTQNYLNRYWDVSVTGIQDILAQINLEYEPEDVSGNDAYIKMQIWNGSNWAGYETASENSLSGEITEFGSFTGFGNTVSIDELSDENNISVFVNNGFLNIVSKTNLSGSNIYIFNSIGQLLNTSEINSSNCKINIGNLKTGYYLLQIKGKNLNHTSKFIVSRN